MQTHHAIPGITPAQIRRIRREIEAEIERLIDWLDMIEPDPDLEPSLAAVESASQLSYGTIEQITWASGNDDDREGDEHDGREPDVDDEPSLASLDAVIDQRKSWPNADRWGVDMEVGSPEYDPFVGPRRRRRKAA